MESDLFSEICSYKNLEIAFRNARKGKTRKAYVVEFEKNLKNNLLRLRKELIFHYYHPKPLVTFIISDPKTRRISKSEFRDRIIHHALINIIEPIFDINFIHDNFANRINKGAFNAVSRFDKFKRKVSRNNFRECFVLKADIKHYFQTVDHEILLSIIKRKIKDARIIWLIRKILGNFERERERERETRNVECPSAT